MKILGLYLLSVALLVLGLDRTAQNLFDEGQILVGAQQVAMGRVPYRDFWTAYAPGQYWAIGSLFKIFGPFLLVERLWDILLRAALATLAYVMSRDATNPRHALVVWAFALAWLWFVNFYGYPLIPGTLFALMAVHFILSCHKDEHRRSRLFLAGVSAGVAGLFRQDIGVYTILVCMAFLLFVEIRSPTNPAIQTAPRNRLATAAVFIAGVLTVTAPAIVYLLIEVPLADLTYALLTYPSSIYAPTRSLPFPSLVPHLAAMAGGRSPGVSTGHFAQAFAIYLPWLAAGLGAATVWQLQRTARLRIGARSGLLTVALLTALVLIFSLKSLVRPHVVHVIHSLIPAFMLISFFQFASRGALRWMSNAIVILLALIMAYPPLNMLYTTHLQRPTVHSAGTGAASIQSGDGPLANGIAGIHRWPHPAAGFAMERDLAAAAAFIAANTTPEDRIFLANGRHDRIFANDVIFYFMAQRQPATKYYEFNPGVTTSAKIQTLIVEDLEESRVSWVVVSRRNDKNIEPNLSALSSGVRILDSYLSANFGLVNRFGSYEIHRRSEPAPAGG